MRSIALMIILMCMVGCAGQDGSSGSNRALSEAEKMSQDDACALVAMGILSRVKRVEGTYARFRDGSELALTQKCVDELDVISGGEEGGDLPF